jgi:hypothetical protein
MREAERRVMAAEDAVARSDWVHPVNAKVATEHFRMAEARYLATLDELEWYRAWLNSLPPAKTVKLFALLEREAPDIKRALLEVLETPNPRK